MTGEPRRRSATAGFRVRRTRHVADSAFLSVDDLEVEAPDGEVFHRTVVRHPGAVVAVPVLDDGETVLLLRQYRAPTGAVILEAPAGKRDVDGEPPEVTAARELAEETGWRAGRLQELTRFWNSPGYCDEYTYVYLAADLVETGVPTPTSPEERAVTVERVRLGDVDRLVASGELVDAKTIVGLLLARRFLARTASSDR